MEEKYYVAKSYQNWERCGNPFYSNNKLFTRIKTRCDRCSGSGTYIIPPSFSGTCFQCHGQGIMYKEVRLYTEKEYKALERAAARDKEKRIASEEARVKLAIEQSDQNLREWYSKNGFNEDGVTWLVVGGNTFDIRAILKENNCKFHPLLKWHCAETFALPEGYKFLEIAFDEIYEWYPVSKTVAFLDNAEDVITEKINQTNKTEAETNGVLSQHIGVIGERSTYTVIYDGSKGFDSRYGYTFIHFFKCGNDILTWTTGKELSLNKGTKLALKGTIADHIDYQGIPQTKINRCNYTIIEE